MFLYLLEVPLIAPHKQDATNALLGWFRSVPRTCATLGNNIMMLCTVMISHDITSRFSINFLSQELTGNCGRSLWRLGQNCLSHHCECSSHTLTGEVFVTHTASQQFQPSHC